MDLLRKHMWLCIIIASLFASSVICIIFVLINKCIAKEGELRALKPDDSPEFYAQSNKYHLKDIEEDLPPLPPRTQFLTSASYENLAEQPDYVKMEKEAALLSPPPPAPFLQPERAKSCRSGNVSAEHYDNLGTDENCQDEDYDDLGADENCQDEDYDDLGEDEKCQDEDYDDLGADEKCQDEDYDDLG